MQADIQQRFNLCRYITQLAIMDVPNNILPNTSTCSVSNINLCCLYRQLLPVHGKSEISYIHKYMLGAKHARIVSYHKERIQAAYRSRMHHSYPKSCHTLSHSFHWYSTPPCLLEVSPWCPNIHSLYPFVSSPHNTQTQIQSVALHYL